MSTQIDNDYTARWALKEIFKTATTDALKELATEGYDAVTKNIGDNRKIDGTIGKPNQEKPVEEKPKPFKYTKPEIVQLNVAMPMTKGFLTSSGNAKGLIIHVTEGHIGGKPVAQQTLEYLASLNYGCLTMDDNGIIYCGDKGWNARGAHAGSGGFNGFTNANQRFFGMEVENPGMLEKKGDKFYYSWGTQLKTEGELARVRHAEYAVHPGYYFAMSPAQELSLINFVLWQLDTNKEFDLNAVIGHDEWRPDGKQDPGGALSMSVPAFRDKIKALIT